MPELALCSPLAAVELPEPCLSGIELLEASPRTAVRVQVRGAHAEVDSLLGTPLPIEPNTTAGVDPVALWLAPDDWLVVSHAVGDEALRERLSQRSMSAFWVATDVSHAYAVLALSGSRARELLCAGCGLDVHSHALAPGRCVRTRFAQIGLLIHAREPDRFDLYVDRSFARYLWEWLIDGAEILI